MASAYEWRARPVSFPLDSFGFRKIFIDSIQYWCLSVNVRVYSFVGSPDFQATLPLRRSLVHNDVIYGMQPMVVRGINSNVVRALHHGSGVSYLSRPLVRSDVISGMKPMARQELGSIFFCASMFFFAHNNWIQKGDDQQQWKKPRKRNVVGKKEKRKKQTAPRPMAAAGKNGGVLWRSSKRRFPDFGRCLHLRMSLFRLA